MKRELAAESVAFPSWLHLETLRFLKEEGGGMGEVAQYLRIKAPTASVLIDALVRDGYVKRTSDANDRRRVLLHVTPKGKRCLADATKKRAKVFARVLAPLSASERRQFARILTTITQ